MEPATLLQAGRKRRPLSKAEQIAVYRRDRWLCYWCKRPLVFSPALKLLQLELKHSGFEDLAYYHPHMPRRDAPLLDELGATVDHLQAFSKGGTCSRENFRAACLKCNVRKSDAGLKEWEKRDQRSPVHGKYGEPTSWDGLTSLFIAIAERKPCLLTSTERDWLRALKLVRNIPGGNAGRTTSRSW